MRTTGLWDRLDVQPRERAVHIQSSFSLLTSFGAVVNALMCRIWAEAGEETATADRGMTPEEHTVTRVA